MATDFGEGPSPEGQVVQEYTASVTQLITRTLSLWIKKLPLYIAILGGFLAMLRILEIVVGYFLLDAIYVAGLPSDPASLFTQIVYAVLYPESVPSNNMNLILISSIFLIIGCV